MDLASLLPTYLEFSPSVYASETFKNETESLSSPTKKPLNPEKIFSYLKTHCLGGKILYTFSTLSTNEDAKRASPLLSEGTLLLCETQKRGKGRLGRQWESPEGGIFMSAILKPSLQPPKIPALSLVAGLAVAKALGSVGLKAKVKWPNDVLINNRKIAGILCEMTTYSDKEVHVIIGIGINANLSESGLSFAVRDKTTSVKIELGSEVDRDALIANVLNVFEPYYFEFLKEGMAVFLPEMEKRMAYVGRSVYVYNTASHPNLKERGIFRGIDPDGRLLLLTPEGLLKTFAVGDVSLRPKMPSTPRPS